MKPLKQKKRIRHRMFNLKELTIGGVKLSRTSAMHYWKLVFRSGLFLLALLIYLNNKDQTVQGMVETSPALMMFIWVVMFLEIVIRFLPSSIESMGCQKQFKKNFKSTGCLESLGEGEKVKLDTAKGTFISAAAWIILNGIVGALYFNGIISEGILVLISLAYSVCDMICILFFCPFQTWFMKNRCCTTCRIYNWDYAMMFTPLIFIIDNSFYTASLVVLSVILLIRWEYTVKVHPERFTEAANESLKCMNCTEKLCHHKKQLRAFMRNQ